MKSWSNRGIMGLGALIVFIAVLLIVGVTGIILLTSGGSLQQKSQLKAMEGKKGVSSGLEVVSIIGTNAHPTDSTPHQLENLHMMVRLLPGTISLNLNTTLIYIEGRDFQQTTVFNSSCSSECSSSSTHSYMVYYLKEGTHYEAGYVNLGDVAKLSIRTNPIREDEDIKIHIIPPHGPQTVIKFQTPLTMVDRRITVWPTS
ncbi:MAG: hypothetical protein GF416_03240 [Candidatus Altiarchaeales archaeon]|nr:hypothetical protein [Candidatus Altiarchaeales archaeon]MBD3416134.1 hypothetical protein [Candidatus Altiarchaeales archaeon]